MIKRTIRSFVRRQGRLTTGQKNALENLSAQYGIGEFSDSIDMDVLFQRKAKRYLEIGTGNGETLLAMAREHPERDYLGIEVHQPGVGHCLAEIKKQELSNIRLVCDDAVEILKEKIPDNSLYTVYIFFPDPWHKKRHHKRRLVQDEFVELIAKKIQPSGFLHLATDWSDYAEHMLKVLNKNPLLINSVKQGGYIKRPTDRPLTKFESRGLRLGHSIHDLIYQKISATDN